MSAVQAYNLIVSYSAPQLPLYKWTQQIRLILRFDVDVLSDVQVSSSPWHSSRLCQPELYAEPHNERRSDGAQPETSAF